MDKGCCFTHVANQLRLPLVANAQGAFHRSHYHVRKVLDPFKENRSLSNEQGYDIYQQDELKLDYEPMDAEKLAEYREQYGSTKNAYLRGEQRPKLITGVCTRYGLAEDVIKSSLFANDELHAKHMCRILAIFFEKGEFGNKGSKFVITHKQKQRGMLYGFMVRRTNQLSCMGGRTATSSRQKNHSKKYSTAVTLTLFNYGHPYFV